MRVDPNLSSILNSGIQSTAQALQTSVTQLSSGTRVSVPSDDPYAAAANARSLAASADVDRYTANGNAVQSQVQMADAALSSVVGELTQAVSMGTRGADGSMTAQDRASIATEVQGVLAQVVSQANQKFNGVNLFAGTTTNGAAFVADPASSTGYTYQGNSGVNQAPIGDSLQVTMNVPGDQIFTNPNGDVIGSLSSMINALNNNDASAVASATASLNNAIGVVGQQRAIYAGTANQISAQEEFLSQETVCLSSQQQALTGIDITTAITNMTQAQTAHSAMLAAAAKILPTSLLDYLK